MATTEQPLGTADDRAWELFLDSLDASGEHEHAIPPGAAIVAADSPDRDFLIRRYHADNRSVVLVDAAGHIETLRPRRSDRERLLLVCAGAALAWFVLRSPQVS